MGTSYQERPESVAAVLAELASAEPLDDEPRPRRRARWKWPLAAGVLLALAALGAAGLIMLRGRFDARSASALMTHVVKRGELLITITADGSLDSADNQDIKCEVAGGSTILWIIEDGKEVKAGAELVRLDSSKLEEDLNQQRIAYEKARASDIQAEKDYAAAKIAVQEYLEGTFRKDLQEAESKVAVALEGLRSAENGLLHSQRMFRKGYITPLQLEAQQFAVEKGRLDLGTAQTGKDVLVRFTRPKMVQELESKRDAAEAKRNSEKASLALEESKLKRKETQVKKCLIRAPKAGMVVYANERMYFGDRQGEVKEGMTVHEEQTILRLPDLSRMQVKASIHESKVDQLSRGMRARIRVQDREFQGRILLIANRPESNWFSQSDKKYPATVEIDGKPKGLRPGMTAEVEILVAQLSDVLSLPVAAVYEHDAQAFCYVKSGRTTEKRNLVLGQGNDKFVEVKAGLQGGEEVTLNPRAQWSAAGEETSKPPAVDVKKKFGNPAPASPSEAKPRKTAPEGDAKTKAGGGQPSAAKSKAK
jgi:multidrug efflux pump subunit AcrA (membrane-fusion protein)